jgi:acylphosphatase
MAKAIRARFLVRGRVQGVGYRWWAADEARQLGLAGWIRNRRDGSVEVEAGGEQPLLDRFRERLEEGPAAAFVDEVQTARAGSDPLPSPFQITP